MIIVSADPGLRRAGLAVHDDGVLLFAGVIHNPIPPPDRGPAVWRAMARAVAEAFPLKFDVLVLETQQDDSRNADPDDLRELSGVVGAIVGILDGSVLEVVGYKPGQWSTVPKDVRFARLRKDLPAGQWEAVEDPDDKEILDAICLGRFELERRGVLQ